MAYPLPLNNPPGLWMTPIGTPLQNLRSFCWVHCTGMYYGIYNIVGEEHRDLHFPEFYTKSLVYAAYIICNSRQVHVWFFRDCTPLREFLVSLVLPDYTFFFQIKSSIWLA